jgi:hypothetical protein
MAQINYFLSQITQNKMQGCIIFKQFQGGNSWV